MKNDKKTSLTSKERKAQRRAGAESSQSICVCEQCGKKLAVPAGKILDCPECGTPVSNIPEIVPELESIQPGVVDPPVGRLAFSRKNIYWIIAAVCMAAVLITFAVLTPVVFMPMYEYRDVDNPVAVIELSNGGSVKLEIFEKEVPDLATNFLYLARKGFFNGTIIFDTTNQYVRFGQIEEFESGGTMKLRSQNTKFTDAVKDMTVHKDYPARSKFDYRMNRGKVDDPAKRADSSNVQRAGYLSLCYNISGTEFQICTSNNAQLEVDRRGPVSSRKTMNGYVLGVCIGASPEESLKTVKGIAAMEQLDDYTVNPWWNPPKETVTIKNIKLYKMDYWGKWRTFHWDNDFKSKMSYWAVPSLS